MKRTRNQRSHSVDRLSALPDDILCGILSHLTTKQAVEVCLQLSKRFHRLWISIPSLNFNDYDWPRRPSFNKFVRECLSLREKFGCSLNALTLSFHKEPQIRTITRILNYADKHEHGFEYFHLTFPYCSTLSLTLPDVVSNFQNLKYLQLNYVILGEALNFPSLITLYLSRCRLYDNTLPNCPNLENLRLNFCFSEKEVISINGPNVKSFVFKEYSIKDRVSCKLSFPSLVYADIDVSFPFNGTSEALIQMLRGVCNAKILLISPSMKFKALIGFLTSPELEHYSSFMRLKALKVQCYKKSVKIPAPEMADLFRGCPLLDTLSIELKQWRYCSGDPNSIKVEITKLNGAFPPSRGCKIEFCKHEITSFMYKYSWPVKFSKSIISYNNVEKDIWNNTMVEVEKTDVGFIYEFPELENEQCVLISSDATEALIVSPHLFERQRSPFVRSRPLKVQRGHNLFRIPVHMTTYLLRGLCSAESILVEFPEEKRRPLPLNSVREAQED